MITIKNRRMIVPAEERYLGMETDTNASYRVFNIPRYSAIEMDMSALAFFLDIKYEDGSKNETVFSDKIVNDDNIQLTWHIAANDLGSSGTIFLQIKANDASGKVKWRSFEENFFVGNCIDGAGNYTGELSAYEALVTRCVLIEDGEINRVNKENSRKASELERDSYEADRRLYEINRKTSETDRKASETDRKTSETDRKASELSRRQAETERVVEFDQMMAKGYIEPKNPVANYAALSVSYPHPQIGWTVQTLNDGKIYRFNGTNWIWIETLTSSGYAALLTEIINSRGGYASVNARFINHDAQLAQKANEAALNAERARIDLLIAPPAGVDNAETADIRVGANGEIYDSAGAATRGQFADLNDAVFDISINDVPKNKYSSVTSMYMDAGDEFHSAGVGLVVYTYAVQKNKRYHITAPGYALAGAYVGVAFSTALPVAGNSFTRIFLASTTPTDIDLYYNVPDDGYICISKAASGDITACAEVVITKTSKINYVTKKTLKIQLFGDSVTDNTWGDLKTWANLIQNNMPSYDVALTNSAVGGSFLRRASVGDNSAMDLVTNGTTLLLDNDIIIVWAGTNDWGSSGPILGTFLDGTNSIYGAVQSIINYVSTHTTAQLVFITPLERYNATDQSREVDSSGTPINNRGYTLRQFCDAIVETCKHYGVPYIDMNAISGINRINITNFTTDGLHPNDAGDARLATIICNFIKQYI